MKLENKKIYAVIGPNGCGKTTLFHQIFQQYHDHEIFFVQQNELLIEELNVYENLRFCHYDFFDDKMNSFLELERIQKLYPLQISLGQRQMVAIICALSSQKELILLDETFSGLNEKRLEKMMNLCQEYVHHHECAMLIVTHQKEVEKCCDEIINFHDGIPCIDNMELKLKEKQSVSICSTLKMQERHWIRHLIYLLVISICFVFVGTIWAERECYYARQEEQLKAHMSVETFIMNNTDIYNDFHDFELVYPSISIDVEKKIRGVKGLSDFEPFLHLSIEPKRKNQEIYYEPVFVYQGNHKSKRTLEIGGEYLIHPYTTYSRMDESVKYQTSHQNGLILKQSSLEMLGLEDVRDFENVKIELSVSIPVSQTPNDSYETSVGYENGEFEFRKIDARNIVYKEVKMTFDIKGIMMNDDETVPFNSRTYAFAYLDIETIKNIQSKYNVDYQPNAYFAKINDLKDVSQIKEEVEKISPTLVFESVYDMYQLESFLVEFLHTLTLVSIIPLVLLTFMLFYTVIIQRKKRFVLYERCLSYGYSSSMCYWLIIKRYMLDGILSLIFYFCMSYLNQYVVGYVGLLKASIPPFMIVVFLILICVLPIGVDIYVMHRKYHRRMEA